MSLLAIAPDLDEANGADELTYDQARSRRAPGPKRRLALHDGAARLPTHYRRPRTRVDCVDGPRPCGFVACRYHLAFDVTSRGRLVENFPEREIGEMPATCALDVADRGGTSLAAVGVLLNVTRERVRQIEGEAIAKVRALVDLRVNRRRSR